MKEQNNYNKYIIKFDCFEGIDDIKIKVKQIDRSNGEDDVDVIRRYILDNYGYRDYEIINIDFIEEIIL